jgi:Na+-transporting NADH:ubiquinone oxidoreductase subunit NqrC
MPFIVLLVGLLGGALISLLVISTTLAEGSYRITNLQAQNASLDKQQQLITDQVANLQNQQVIEKEAAALGMQPDPYLRFLNPKTGKTSVSKAYAP